MKFFVKDPQNNCRKIPVATYSFLSTIRNRIFDYVETTHSIFVSDEISSFASAGTFDWKRSEFRDEYYGHLKSLLSKRPNYRERNTINYGKYKIAIDPSIDNCIEKLKTKGKIRENDLKDWKDFVKQKVSKRIKKLRKHSYFLKTFRILNNGKC